MRYEEQMVLKDGRVCILRNAEEGDGAEVHRSFNLTHGETDFLLSYPDENSFDVEQERRFLTEKAEDPREAELCAWIDGRLVGTAGIEAVGKKDKVKRRAVLGVSVEKAYWGLGVGRALVLACIRCAGLAGYAQLELEVVAENTRAVALYESVGFLEFGRNPRGFYSRRAGWQEVVLMRLELA